MFNGTHHLLHWLEAREKEPCEVFACRVEVGHNGDCSVAHHQQGVGRRDMAHNLSKTSVTWVAHIPMCNLPFNVESAHTTHGMPTLGWCANVCGVMSLNMSVAMNVHVDDMQQHHVCLVHHCQSRSTRLKRVARTRSSTPTFVMVRDRHHHGEPTFSQHHQQLFSIHECSKEKWFKGNNTC